MRASLYATAWHLSIVSAILLVPAWIVYRSAFWLLKPGDVWLIVGSACAYLIATISGAFVRRRFGRAGPATCILAAVVPLSVVYLGALLQPGREFSRAVLVYGSLLVLAGVAVSVVLRHLRPSRMAQAAAVTALALTGMTVSGTMHLRARVGPQTTERVIAASQHILAATYYAGFLPAQAGPTREWGGAIAAAPDGEGYLLVRSPGDVFRLSWDKDGELRANRLPLEVPINVGEFVSDNPALAGHSFRVAGVASRKLGAMSEIYVAHHYWNRDQGCYVVRVSRHAFPPGQSGSERWQTIFESRPCLKIIPSRGTSFAGEQIGGRLQFLDEHSLLITVGDHQFDGWYKPFNYVQDPESSYGKTLLVDLRSGSASVFTMGHRNPQGLAVDPLGRIWETEHGPQGGDELNLLASGGNYGYPYHTHGTEYGSVDWPAAKRVPGDEGHIRPLFAWVPSIGVSDLVFVADPAFDKWRGDLLVGSLRGQALWRLRIEEGRVVYSEPISVGERVRSIAAGEGEFVLWTDSDTIVRIRPAGEVAIGAALVNVRCGGCHDRLENRIGPHLRGIVGREIASLDEYAYSAALAVVGGTWTEERLDRFLADPSTFAPGNRMAMDGIADAELRNRIIAQLKR